MSDLTFELKGFLLSETFLKSMQDFEARRLLLVTGSNSFYREKEMLKLRWTEFHPEISDRHGSV